MNGGGAVSLLAIKVATRLRAIELKVDQFDFRLTVVVPLGAYGFKSHFSLRLSA
jgi:hypothetical protein